jgi:uncharacterized protein (UPF0332 family)
VDSSRRSGVIALFQEHYVKTGIVSQDVARTLPQAFARRQRSYYGNFADAQPADVQSLRVRVIQFIDACEAVVRSATDGSGN